MSEQKYVKCFDCDNAVYVTRESILCEWTKCYQDRNMERYCTGHHNDGIEVKDIKFDTVLIYANCPRCGGPIRDTFVLDSLNPDNGNFYWDCEKCNDRFPMKIKSIKNLLKEDVINICDYGNVRQLKRIIK